MHSSLPLESFQFFRNQKHKRDSDSFWKVDESDLTKISKVNDPKERIDECVLKHKDLNEEVDGGDLAPYANDGVDDRRDFARDSKVKVPKMRVNRSHPTVRVSFSSSYFR